MGSWNKEKKKKLTIFLNSIAKKEQNYVKLPILIKILPFLKRIKRRRNINTINNPFHENIFIFLHWSRASESETPIFFFYILLWISKIVRVKIGNIKQSTKGQKIALIEGTAKKKSSGVRMCMSVARTNSIDDLSFCSPQQINF